MTIASLPVSTVQYESASSPVIAVMVLEKSLDTAELSGQSMIKMMEQSVTPNLGTNIDLRV